ncbi:MAG: response regulator transcription factor [Promethearchaeota archaeon]
MDPLILLVDDNPDILENLKLALEFNRYRVITAENGKVALELLSNLEIPPDIVISDIMMPKMDGYEFFQEVSENSDWNHIPFFFLTARSAQSDIRFGKLLGVDDYITKPVNIDDLLARISGTLSRRKKMKILSTKINRLFSSLKSEFKPSISETERGKVQFFMMDWDDILGPQVKAFFPPRNSLPLTLEDLGTQLYQATISIYGHSDSYDSHGVLLSIKNIEKDGYLFFDTVSDSKVRGGRKQFMFALIAPKINYFESLKIKEVLTDLSSQIKRGLSWNSKIIWKKLSKILSSPFF